MPYAGVLERLDPWRVRLPKQGKMRADGKVFASEAMVRDILQDEAVQQVANVATLPGILGDSMAMPDIHWGYGFPIGGVAAFDADEGVVSPGGVGFDINCGVRLIRTDLTMREVRPHLRDLVDRLFDRVPSGVGEKSRVRLSRQDVEAVFVQGARWAVDHGYAWEEDLARIEHEGTMPGAVPSKVSERATTRGAPQAGSLGGGNHFLEVQRVAETFDAETARVFGLDRPDQVVVMIHSGSRGAGHQICSDYVARMEKKSGEYGIDLVDPQLAAAPVTHRDAEDYYGAMCCGVNFAWANRTLITHGVREVFEKVFGQSAESLGMRLVYDVAHNIAKLEEHVVDGRRRKVYVHRKGATRAFAPGHPLVSPTYRAVGQPVLVPGDMGTASYVLAGTEQAMAETFGSACHGAGRVMSRTKAAKSWSGSQVLRELEKQGIIVRAASEKVAAEEAPDAYKDVGDVVDVCHGAGIARKVARLEPVGCVKG